MSYAEQKGIGIGTALVQLTQGICAHLTQHEYMYALYTMIRELAKLHEAVCIEIGVAELEREGEDMAGTTAANWYKSAAEFEEVCADAVRLAHGERAEEFAHQMLALARRDHLNVLINANQLRYLCMIADHIMPPARNE